MGAENHDNRHCLTKCKHIAILLGMATVSEEIKKAILSAKVSRYQIAKDTGVEQAILSRFVNGRTGLSSKSIDQLAEYFGYRLVKRRGK